VAGALQGPTSRTGRKRNRRRVMADINVTPMVDVMLVLLVVFMVTAPLLTVGVQVDLPKTAASTIQGQDEPISVTIRKDGKIFLQETELELDELAPRLTSVSGANPDIRIFVRGDKDIEYGKVMEVMGRINAAGFKRVALVTDIAKPAPAPARGP
jgi:biopolymer transport protein TolR